MCVCSKVYFICCISSNRCVIRTSHQNIAPRTGVLVYAPTPTPYGRVPGVRPYPNARTCAIYAEIVVWLTRYCISNYTHIRTDAQKTLAYMAWHTEHHHNVWRRCASGRAVSRPGVRFGWGCVGGSRGRVERRVGSVVLALPGECMRVMRFGRHVHTRTLKYYRH